MDASTAPMADSPMTGAKVFECCVCYEDGTKTGKLTLACSHDICLGCYTNLCAMTGTYGQAVAPTCPICRASVRTREGHTDDEKRQAVAVLRRLRLARQRQGELAIEVSHNADLIRTAEAERTALMSTQGWTGEELDALPTTGETALSAQVRPFAQPDFTRRFGTAPPMAGTALVRNAQGAYSLAPVGGAAAPAVVAVAPANTDNTASCPGCSQHKPGVKYRHVWRKDGVPGTWGIHKLKRCLDCRTAQRREYVADCARRGVEPAGSD